MFITKSVEFNPRNRCKKIPENQFEDELKETDDDKVSEMDYMIRVFGITKEK